ncbi:hypothetical protein CORC01_10894 [Colletotrichum orchidophilum]|uniref:Uncharacterized protein n=1 Tax=Colletotrichum orchidophilum TaxID=1209926 RepID=A0A1G4AX73_9PEZI|nr:uncharacterized protein CORC01_10894 [Colletotrichum orchidophilum]OHE93768.1 hypothetical protein CORC01_10894 [Colletotrichum orchidophilum]
MFSQPPAASLFGCVAAVIVYYAWADATKDTLLRQPGWSTRIPHSTLRRQPAVQGSFQVQGPPLEGQDSKLRLGSHHSRMDSARPGPPGCRPSIAHAPLKKPVHGHHIGSDATSPNSEQELTLFCCAASFWAPKSKSTSTVAIQLPLDPCSPVRPTTPPRLLPRERAKPSQYCCQLPPIDHPVPSHQRSSACCSFLTSSSPSQSQGSPSPSKSLALPHLASPDPTEDRLDDSTVVDNLEAAIDFYSRSNWTLFDAEVPRVAALVDETNLSARSPSHH